MKKVNEMLEKAIKLSTVYLTEASGVINDKRKADIASFGTALKQSGILPAVAQFSDTTTKSGKRRNQMLNVLFALCGGNLTKTDFDNHNKIFLADIITKDATQRAAKRQDLMSATIALKLAVRTFHLETINDDNE
jgi:hypothetical protein